MEKMGMDNKNNSNGDFKMKVSEWRGYVLRAIEDVEKTLTKNEEAIEELRKEMLKCRECHRKEFQKMLDKFEEKFSNHQQIVKKDVGVLHKRLTGIYIKVVAVGATVGVASAIVFGLFQKYILSALGL
jgi:hypothetical protein